MSYLASSYASAIQSLCSIADLLAAQNNLLRNPSFELRSVCFIPLKLALESKRSKLVSLALTGLNVCVSSCTLRVVLFGIKTDIFRKSYAMKGFNRALNLRMTHYGFRLSYFLLHRQCWRIVKTLRYASL